MHIRILTVVLGIFFFSPAFAKKNTRFLRKSHGWSSYTYTKNKEQVCYAIEKVPPFQILMINRTLKETQKWAWHVFALVSKKDLKTAVLKTDLGKKFELLADKNSAWATSEQQDTEIWLALSSERQAEVSGVYQDGTVYKTRISLLGLQKAVNIIDVVCPNLGSKSSSVSPDTPQFGTKQLPEGI